MRVNALCINPHELKILFPEDPSCYLAMQNNNSNLISIFAFDQSYLEYIKKVIAQAISQKKYIKISLELVPVISYKQSGSERIYESRFVYINYSDIKHLIYVDE